MRCLLALAFAALSASAAWHHPLYLGRGDYWRQRLPVVVANQSGNPVSGQPVAVPAEALAGQRIDTLRVIDEAGTDLLFAVVSATGQSLTRGPVPAGASLHLPVECGPRESKRYFVYFDNPSAWGVPDFLRTLASGDLNGDFERGDGPMPDGWSEKSTDDQHRNYWVAENPQSGAKCLKTVVAPGAEPNWVSVHRSRLAIVPGANYTITAWARAENAVGRVGWFLHVGNAAKPMLHAPLQETGEGTYDWRQVTFTFTAPEEANQMTVGTVLWGTGTAWYDSLAITCDTPDPLVVSLQPAEPCPMQFEAPREEWDLPAADWPRRLAVQAANPEAADRPHTLVHSDLGEALRGSAAAAHLRLMRDGQPVPFALLNGNLLFPASLPAQSVQTYWLYVARDAAAAARSGGEVRLGSAIPSDQVFLPTTERTDPRAYAALLALDANLVKNPSFETGEPLPEHWPGSSERQAAAGVQYGLDSPGVFGPRCARIVVPHESQPDWVGWRQDVPVVPGRSYLFATWLKTEDIRNGSVNLHAHQRQPDGSLCGTSPHLSAGSPLSGTSDWTLASGVTRIPADGGILQVHLTMRATGTVRHDGVLVAEVLSATPGRLETRAAGGAEELVAWSANPIVKIFRDDLPPTAPAPVRIALARNEQEPLQLVVRSPSAVPDFRYELTIPKHATGRELGILEQGVVGYVPIDHRTSYYRSDAPVWQRMTPSGQGSSDGWSGWWPDPILPRQTAELAANECQPLWITFASVADSPAGEYLGEVRFFAGETLLRRVPITVVVWDFALPETITLGAIYDLRFRGEGWDRPGMSRDDTQKEMLRFMAKRKISADRMRAEPVFRREGERIVADFAAYDEAMSLFFDELGMPFAYTPNTFYLFGWAHPAKRFLGEHPFAGEFPYEGADWGVLRAEYKQVYQECLRQYWEHMKSKGWAEKLVLYISDEPHFTRPEIRRQMQALCDMIHEVDPAIPIYSSTWRHCPEWNGYLDVWGVGSYGCFPVEEMAAQQAAGHRIWFTTDGQMCTDTPYCAIERMLPHYCFRYGAEAYEFWGIAWLTYNPYEFGWHSYIPQSDRPGSAYHVRYPNGDGFLVYPGAPIGHDGVVSSIRLEAARDGVEDYDYLTLLAALAERHGDAAGRALIEEAKTLVDIPNPGGRHSTRILPDPDAIPRLRERLAAEILRLQAK